MLPGSVPLMLTDVTAPIVLSTPFQCWGTGYKSVILVTAKGVKVHVKVKPHFNISRVCFISKKKTCIYIYIFFFEVKHKRIIRPYMTDAASEARLMMVRSNKEFF